MIDATAIACTSLSLRGTAAGVGATANPISSDVPLNATTAKPKFIAGNSIQFERAKKNDPSVTHPRCCSLAASKRQTDRDKSTGTPFG